MTVGERIKERPRAKEEDQILVDGLHEAIIDKNTFDLAQKYLSGKSTVPVPGKLAIKNPLAGLIICAKCKKKMVRRPYTNGYPDGLICANTACDNVSSPLELVEKKLIYALEKWLHDYKIILKGKGEKDDTIENSILENTLERIEQELEKLTIQANNLYDLLEQEVYSVDVFTQRSKIVKNKMSKLETDKAALQNKLNKTKEKEKSKKELVPKVEQVLESYNNIKDPAEKNKLLKEVLHEVIYLKEKGGRWSGEVDAFTLDLVPKIPK